MKRSIKLVIAMIILTFALTGCSASDDTVKIGISYMPEGSEGDFDAYVLAVEAAGAEAVALPLIEDEEDADAALETVDAVVLTGGEDVNPALYGEEAHEKLETVIDERDTSDILLYEAVVEADMPMLATCRGLQIMNVAEGGTLYQDIPAMLPDALMHRDDANEEFSWHNITIEKDSILAEAFPEGETTVNSWHHQGIKDLGDNLVVTATADDGIIEGIEREGSTYIYGVQFHPEWHMHSDYGDEEFISFFTHLVEAVE